MIGRIGDLGPGAGTAPMISESYTESPLVKRTGWLRKRAWIICAASVVAVLIGGSVTNRMSFAVAAVTLATPAALCAGFAVAEWLEARRAALLLPRGHLAGPGVALVVWLLYSSGGGGDLFFSKEYYCRSVIGDADAACLREAGQALQDGRLISWITLAVLVALALLARRSRVAAWSTIPIALAGQTLALQVLMPLKDAYGL
jgi:hypothetical protein